MSFLYLSKSKLQNLKNADGAYIGAGSVVTKNVRKNEKIVQDQTDIQIKKVEEKVISKEKEIMTI